MKDFTEKEKDEKYKSVMIASFLYIDENGFEFYGWDWYDKNIFYIPKIAIIQRREQNHVDEHITQILCEIGWSEKFIKK